MCRRSVFFDKTAGCCSDDSDCDDGEPCTKNDYCDKVSMTCVIAAPIDPCCRSDDDCDDGDSCTVDSCQENLLCSNVWQKGSGLCCSYDEDCLDLDSCTLDYCELTNPNTNPPQGVCRHEVLCCDQDEDCADGDSPCMEGVCVFDQGSMQGECDYEWIDGCCVVQDDCERVPCMNVVCDDSECQYDRVPGCCETTVIKEQFDDSGGYTFEPFDREGYAAEPGWVVSDGRSVSPPRALLFGDPETCRCRSADDLKTGGRAISPSVPLMMTKNPVLSFSMYKNTDEISCFNDVLSVFIVSAAGTEKVFTTSELSVFNTCSARDICEFRTFPLNPISLEKWAVESVSIVFEYDSNSALDADYEGVWIDDVSVTGTCN